MKLICLSVSDTDSGTSYIYIMLLTTFQIKSGNDRANFTLFWLNIFLFRIKVNFIILFKMTSNKNGRMIFKFCLYNMSRQTFLIWNSIQSEKLIFVSCQLSLCKCILWRNVIRGNDGIINFFKESLEEFNLKYIKNVGTLNSTLNI